MNERVEAALEALRKVLEICEVEGIEFHIGDGLLRVSHSSMRDKYIYHSITPEDISYLKREL